MCVSGYMCVPPPRNLLEWPSTGEEGGDTLSPPAVGPLGGRFVCLRPAQINEKA